MMQKIILSKSLWVIVFLLFLFTMPSVFSQVNLLTTGGVVSGRGIVSINSQRQTKLLHSFPVFNPINCTTIITGNDGNLYGISGGGNNEVGLIFSIQQNGNALTAIHHFSKTGTHNYNALAFGPDGFLYFIEDSSLFSIHTDGSFLKEIAVIPNSQNNSQGIVIDKEGWIYGTLLQGVYPSLFFTLFKIKTDGSGFQELHTFNENTDGSSQRFNFMVASNNRIYGCNSSGGTNGGGTVYRLNKDGSDFSVLYYYSTDSAAKGGTPAQDGQLLENNGKIYFTTTRAGNNSLGTINSFDTATNYVTPVYHFTSLEPQSQLVEANSKLWGLNASGLFSINFNGTGFQQISNTYSGIALRSIQDANSLFYCSNEGLYIGGFIAKIDASSSAVSNIFNFGNASGGYYPNGMVKAASGSIYGCTQFGGLRCGTLFKLDKNGENYKKIFDFTGNGMMPVGTPLLLADGKLYGFCNRSGINGISNNRLVYRIDTTGDNYQVLKVFDYTTEGEVIKGLVDDGNGHLFGVSTLPGNNSSFLFRMNTDGTGFTRLKTFNSNGTEGSFPAEHIAYSAGKIYGVMTLGAALYNGLLYSINIDGTGFTIIHNFDVNETYFLMGVSALSNGKIYGYSWWGGTGGMGVVFSFDPLSNTYKIINNLSSSINYNFPSSKIYEAEDGRLYFSEGYTIFSIDKDGNVALNLYSPGNFFDFNNSLIEIPNNNNFCEGSPARFTSNIAGTGYTYQWQSNTGAGYTNLANSGIFSGVNTPTLQLSSVSSAMNNYQFRCAVDTGGGILYSSVSVSSVLNSWLGTADTNWNNAANWSCGAVPNANTAVFIAMGLTNYPVITSTVTCKMLEVQPGAIVKVDVGGNVVLTGQ